MKKFVISLSLILLFVLPVFADDVVTGSAVADPVTVIVNNDGMNDALELLASIASRSAINTNDNEIRVYDEPVQLRSVNVSNETISANDTNGFKSVVLGIIGDYTTIVTDYTYSNTQGYTQHSIDVTPDWSWIVCCALFAIVVFCFFKLVGGFLCKR